MEKNKQDLKEDIFLREYLKEIKLEVPKSNFTDNIMDVLLKEEKKIVLKPEPLISKKIWFLLSGLIASSFWFLLKGKSTTTLAFPKLDLNFLSKIQITNFFENISMSNTLFYVITFFTIMIFVQIMYLKNHFDSKYD